VLGKTVTADPSRVQEAIHPMRWLIEAVCWAAVCVGIWLLTLSVITGQEIIVACAAAALCGAAAVGGRRVVGGHWAFRPGWLGWLVKLPVSAVIEAAQVLWSALRGRGGEEVTVQLPEDESEQVSASRRGFGAVALSASPGSYVVDADPDRCRLLVHRLGGGAPRPVRIDPGEA
jgi:hypothetical protein